MDAEQLVEHICKNCKSWNGQHWGGMTFPGSCGLVNRDSLPAWINTETKYPEFIEKAEFITTADFGCNQWQEE